MGQLLRMVKQGQEHQLRCRSCARLSYSSEGGFLRGGGRGALAAIFRAYGNLPRPESWFPYVFTSIDDPRLDEILRRDQLLRAP